MGFFEVTHFWILTSLLVSIIIIILSVFSFKNLLNRFGLLKSSRREFYECGFKPINQKPIAFSFQFMMLIIFFLIYDIELIFSFPLVALTSEHVFLEYFGFVFLYVSFILSLIFDYDKNILNWKI